VDQINDILIAGNTILIRVEDLLNGGEILVKDGIRLNGVFGKQGMLRREQVKIGKEKKTSNESNSNIPRT